MVGPSLIVNRAPHGTRRSECVLSSDPDVRRQQIKLIVAVVVFIAAGAVAWITMGGETVEDIAADRAFICGECGAVFEHTLQIGEYTPLECDKCGKKAAYPAETCYWTKGPNDEWKAKLEPTFVLLKKRVDPESDEKTFCPDCGREVVGHNPPPPEELMEAARNEAGK